jgi:hypothetical protein
MVPQTEQIQRIHQGSWGLIETLMKNCDLFFVAPIRGIGVLAAMVP